MVNSVGPRSEPWGTPLLTDYQPDVAPFTKTPLSNIVRPVHHPAKHKLIYLTDGCCVQKDAIRDSIKDLTEIQKDRVVTDGNYAILHS